MNRSTPLQQIYKKMEVENRFLIKGEMKFETTYR